VVLKVHNICENSVMFFNMGISLHFWQTENETGKELRSSEKHNLCLYALFGQPVVSNVW